MCIQNYFGENAEIKSEAISYREKYLLTIASSGKTLIIDFNNVLYSPHSFLNALLASTIRTYEKAGYNPYKKIKIVNAKPDIRETIDYILKKTEGKTLIFVTHEEQEAVWLKADKTLKFMKDHLIK